MEIPGDINSTFYKGQVYVSLNDSVFQPSTPLGHAASLASIHMKCGLPIALLFTDGGPDHRLNFESVRVSLIALFLKCDLDMLVAARCCPGQSWMNPVERIMSLLNLGLQNVALGRTAGDSEFEEILRKCQSMKNIRDADERYTDADIRGNWTESVTPMVKKVRERFERLALKDKPIKTMDPVQNTALEELRQLISERVDTTLDFNKLQKKHTDKCKGYQDWTKRHVRCRTYSYQIRKCDDLKCCVKRSMKTIEWLPDPQIDDSGDHYKRYDDVVGHPTKDDERPSNQPYKGKISDDDQGCSTSMLVAQRARSYICCMECKKPRVVYCLEPKKVTIQELMDLEVAVEQYDYSCGSPLIPTNHPLYKKVFVRRGITCANHIEFAFYSGGIGNPLTCCYCGEDGGSRPQELVIKYKVVLPICGECHKLGRECPTSHPRH